jgi:glucose/mannose transport system substrate-binding protein
MGRVNLSVRAALTVLMAVAPLGCGDDDAEIPNGAAGAFGQDSGPSARANDVEIANWWKLGGNIEALTAEIETYKSKHSTALVTNFAVDTAALLWPEIDKRLGAAGLAPPELCMTNNGGAGFAKYVPQALVLDDFYVANGWDKNGIPEVLNNVISPDGHFYMVPVGVHRKNILLYNKRLLKLAGVTTLPASTAELIAMLAKLDALTPKIVPMATASDAWVDGILWESIFMSVAGPDYYMKFQRGQVDLNVDSGPLVAAANAMVEVCKYIDRPTSRASRPTVDTMMADQAATFVLADYTAAYLAGKGFPDGLDWGAVVFPGSEKIYSYTVDGYFAFKDSNNPEAAKAFLQLWLGQEGQAAFAPKKYSIPPIKGIDVSTLPEVLRTSYAAFVDPSTIRIGQGSADNPLWCWLEDAPVPDGGVAAGDGGDAGAPKVTKCIDHMTALGPIVKANLMGITTDVDAVVDWYKTNYGRKPQ